jgi:hypothetical protein
MLLISPKYFKELILIFLSVATYSFRVHAQNNRWTELSSEHVLFYGKPNALTTGAEIYFYKLKGDAQDNIYLINPKVKRNKRLYILDVVKTEILKLDETKIELMNIQNLNTDNLTMLGPDGDGRLYTVKDTLIYHGRSIATEWYLNYFDGYKRKFSRPNGDRYISNICSDGNGNLYILDFELNKWDGNEWTSIDFRANFVSIYDWESLNTVYSNLGLMCVDNKGNLFIYCDFKTKDGTIHHIARFNGDLWTELGDDSDPFKPKQLGIHAMAADNNGNLYIAHKRHIYKWNGEKWSELGGKGTSGLNANGIIYTIATDKEGNIYAAGAFTNKSHKRYVAKWDGKSWKELGEGSLSLNANDNIYSIFVNSRNTVFASGKFTNKSKNRYVAIFKQGNE